MIRKLLVFLVLAAGLAFGQGAQRTPTAQAVVNYLGNLKVLSGATVTVCPASGSITNCTPGAVSLFRDVGLTIPQSNPLFADSNGNYTYYVVPGTYGERVCSPGVNCTFSVITLSGASPPGACEILGIHPGDVCYFTGTAWAVLTGNTTTTKLFSESAAGSPAWYIPPQTIAAVTHNFLTSFTASTGVFTQAQPACADLSDSGPGCSSGGLAISAENMIPVMTSNSPSPATTNDIVYTLMPWGPDTAFMGPLPPTNPQSAWVQDKVCSLGSVGPLACQFNNPVIPGDSIYAVGIIQCGLGCVGNTFTMADNFSDAYTQIDTSTGSGFPFGSYYSSGVTGGLTTVTFTPSLTSASYNTQVQIIELRGTVALDVFSRNTSYGVPPIVYNSLTTLLAPDTIIATTTTNVACSESYSAGTGYAMLQQGCLATFASMGSEITNELTIGTYTPTMGDSGASAGAMSIATAFQITLPATNAKPFPRWIRYVDLTASGDFPSLTGNSGECFSTDGNVVTLVACSTGAITSVTGTANQIDVTSGTTPVVSLDSAIIFPGTITMGAHAADFSSATSFKPPGTGGTLTVGTANINWATLGTGVVLNTTTTGAKAVIAAVGTKCYPFQGSGGTGCDTPSGGVTKIFSGTVDIGTSTVNSGACNTATGSPVTATGVLTSDVISATPTVDPSGVSGYAATTAGGLYIYVWPTSDAINAKVCNNTGTAITPGDLVMNLLVLR